MERSKRVRQPTARAEEAAAAKARKQAHHSRPVSADPASAKPPTTPAAVIWPGGSRWRPGTANWGTRSPLAHGCGKCRWNVLGCRGCIAAAADYVAPAPHAFAPGRVRLPVAGIDADCDAGGDRDDRIRGVQALLDSVAVQSDGVADLDGFGVVAVHPISRGTLLRDPSVVFVPRPSAYAVAHLPPYHALELGKQSYLRLREPAFGHVSLTYFVNEANHTARPHGMWHKHPDGSCLGTSPCPALLSVPSLLTLPSVAYLPLP
mmetsp:Transcript_51823/g.169437  ORF Transcript_51823/g.169437 Transcript_51823/m.169437 type:complete len:262 (+) Transcript_51823:125-910(+)